jgi:hypothetical protein
MKPIFIWLWSVVFLFILGVALIFTAAFTTHATDFSGTADLHLTFETEDHRPLVVVLTDASDQPIARESDGSYLLHPKFESRETNVFDTFGGGPHPRNSIVAFFEAGHKHHEISFTYDRHGHIWQAEVAFPDPTIAAVDLVNSSLTFKANEGPRRRYESSIVAKALVGAPIIKND